MSNVNNYKIRLSLDHFSEVRRWHEERSLPAGDADFEDPGFRARRARLVAEEFVEFLRSIGMTTHLTVRSPGGDMVYSAFEGGQLSRKECIDALADMGVVCEGTAVELGWDYNEARRRVQTSNDSKPKTKDENGKIVKGENFVPPKLDDLV